MGAAHSVRSERGELGWGEQRDRGEWEVRRGRGGAQGERWVCVVGLGMGGVRTRSEECEGWARSERGVCGLRVGSEGWTSGTRSESAVCGVSVGSAEWERGVLNQSGSAR